MKLLQIKKEGEGLEFKCRLEDEMEEGEVKMTWFFNDTEITDTSRFVYSWFPSRIFLIQFGTFVSFVYITN